MLEYVPVAFVAEFLESYLLNAGAVTILSKNPRATVIISTITNICRWTTLIIVIKISNWYIPCIVAVSLGDITADYFVSKRWPAFVWRWIGRQRKRKPWLRRTPVTTA